MQKKHLILIGTWKMMKDSGTLGTTSFYYVRGGNSNTVTLDGDSIKFNLNNTGVYYSNGLSSPQDFTWSFSNSAKTEITWVVDLSSITTTVTWNIQTLNSTQLTYIETYDQSGTSWYGVITRAPN
ncbi:MAG TPA: hypothetical protein VKR32_14965 [Puia sp.]|nr:hypothetical protein [Puia sp.]